MLEKTVRNRKWYTPIKKDGEKGRRKNAETNVGNRMNPFRVTSKTFESNGSVYFAFIQLKIRSEETTISLRFVIFFRLQLRFSNTNRILKVANTRTHGQMGFVFV